MGHIKNLFLEEEQPWMGHLYFMTQNIYDVYTKLQIKFSYLSIKT